MIDMTKICEVKRYRNNESSSQTSEGVVAKDA